MHFQLEVDYYSNEGNKNKYKNVQLIHQQKIALWLLQIVLGIVLATTTCHTCSLDFKVLCCLGLVLLESIFIEFESILLLESYVCFSKIYVSISIRYMSIKSTLSFITLVPKFILYYPQMWGYHSCMGSL